MKPYIDKYNNDINRRNNAGHLVFVYIQCEETLRLISLVILIFYVHMKDENV